MPNQPSSPAAAALPGNTTRVLEQTFQNFQQVNGLSDEHPANEYAKYCYYCGLLQMYNTFSEGLRRPPAELAAVTEAMRQDLNAFFSDLDQKQKNKVN